MKLSELKLIIKEEISDFFNSDAPKSKYKKGDTLNYRGTPYTVVSDSGYVVTVVDDKGKESTYNHNQLSQGIYKKPSYLNEKEEMKKYKFEFVHYEYRSTIKVPGTLIVTASNEDEARDKAYEEAKKFCEEENFKLKSSKEEFKLLSVK
jgi:hypothetical protein